MSKPTGYVIYRGKSMLDGQPIVAVAIVSSANPKTGDMVQTHILADNGQRPTEALRTGADESVCGQCPQRPALGGACYVVVAQGPTVVWKGVQADRYPSAWNSAAHAHALAQRVAGRVVRLGTYGDPMAVPADVWERLLAGAAGHTGYTHQWARTDLYPAQREAINRLCMASADSAGDARRARAIGLRYFRTRTPDEALAPREFVCPASDEAGKRTTCAQCQACNGSAKPSAASPVIILHGAKAARVIRLAVAR